MERENRLFEILKALAQSSRKALTIKALVTKARYKDYRELNKDLKKLREMGIIEFRYSGFPSDRFNHEKVVVLDAEPIKVHADAEIPIETPVEEMKKVKIVLNPDYQEDQDLILVKIRNPFVFGFTSYMTLRDFKKLSKAEQQRIFILKENPYDYSEDRKL